MSAASNHYHFSPHTRAMDPAGYPQQKISLPSIPSIPSFRTYPLDQPRVVPEHPHQDQSSPNKFFRPTSLSVSPGSVSHGSLSLPPLTTMGPSSIPPQPQVPMTRHHSDVHGFHRPPPLPVPNSNGYFFPGATGPSATGPVNGNGPVPFPPLFPNVVVLNQPEEARAFHEFQMMRAANQSMGRNPYLEPSAEIRRKRQVRRRTRTGCLTCRRRRIKCDERKPACFNCEKSRKQCAGYEESSKKNKRENSSEDDHSDQDEKLHDSKKKISYLMN